MQAFKHAAAVLCKIAVLLCASNVIQACSMTGRDIDDAVVGAIALTETTSIAAPNPFEERIDAEGAERDRLLDEDTIRNAVTSAGIDSIGADGLIWSNPSTGARGTITGLSQRKESGQICRSFSATRESYDGVTLYRGDLCLDRRTGWWTRMLKPAGSAG
jgi:hypothetical protein